MYVRKSRVNNGRILLSFVVGYRQDGKVKQKYIEHIGYLDELEKIYDDPMAHFKEIAKQRTKETKNEPISIDVNVSLPTSSNRKNLGYTFLQRVYYSLELDLFLNKKQLKENINYRFHDVIRLLTYSRILDPSSIKTTHENKTAYFEKFDLSLKDIYRSLDKLLALKDELLIHLYHIISSIYGIDTSHTYYDCTNYYFEIDYNDNDETNSHGETVKPGLRKRGVSKEHRPHPLVTMALLLDNQGIPISYDIFPGNESEKVTLRPLLNKAKSKYQLDKVIIVADRALNTSDNIFYNNSNHDGYIYSKSLKGADSEFVGWALADDLSQSQNNIKSRVHTFDITIQRKGKRNTKVTVIQKQVVYYSAKFANKARYQRELVIDKAKSLIDNPGKYTRATSVGAAGYVKNINYDKKTGAIIAKDLSLDISKIKEEAKFDGYYAIVTSETHMSDTEIIDRYKGLWKIEESFKIMKSEFKARPVYLSTEDHIRAHFLICYLALVFIRLLERSVNYQYSPAQLIQAMNDYSCLYLDQNYYVFDYKDEILNSLEKVFNLDLSRKFMTQMNIRNLLRRPKQR